MDRRNDYFNPAPPRTIHIDLNSCFATVEQQCDPFLRGKPIGIVPMGGRRGCVIAPSIEAKAMGVKTGMRVYEALNLCPSMLILGPDPAKYRFVHMKLRKLLGEYSPKARPKSIDEFVLDLNNTPAANRGMVTVAREIKARIKEEIGDYLTVSVGIANNQLLAKTAAGLHKPDGLDQIDHTNYQDVFNKLELMDLPGINVGYRRRLSVIGVHSINDMYARTWKELHGGFRSVVGEDWFARLRGWEVDEVEWETKSFSNQRIIYPPIIAANDILGYLSFLTWKSAARMRISGYQARSIFYGLRIFSEDQGPFRYWADKHRFPTHTYASSQMFKVVHDAFYHDFRREYVNSAFVGVSEIQPLAEVQMAVFEDREETTALYQSIDAINHRYGNNTIKPARMLGTEKIASHRISFGSVKEMEQFVFNGENLLDDN